MSNIPMPAPKPSKQSKKRTTSKRKMLEKQIEEVGKMIMFWRDGNTCVMGNMDGSRCGNGLMWNHFIAQKQSSWLKLDIGNFFCGCGSHNMLDFRGDKVLAIWYMRTFGVDCAEKLQLEASLNKSKKRTIPELEAMLTHYDELYQDRLYVKDVGDVNELAERGYYGSVVQQVFRERNANLHQSL